MTDNLTQDTPELTSGDDSRDYVVGQAAVLSIEAPTQVGQTIEQRLEGGQQAVLNFDAAAATPSVDGDNFVLSFDANGDGASDSQIIFLGLVAQSQNADAPVLVINGVEIAANQLIGQALALADGDGTLETAAGGTGAGNGPAGGGGSTYSDDTGESIDLLNAQGVIGRTELGFGLLANVDETTDPAEGTFDITFLSVQTNVPGEGGEGPENYVSGSFAGGFEDWAPNQHLGDNTNAPMQVEFNFTPADNETLDSVVLEAPSNGAVLYIGGTEAINIYAGPFPVTVLPENFEQVYIKPADDSDADITLNATANISDPDSGDSASIQVTVVAVIDAAADKPVFNDLEDDRSRAVVDGPLEEEALVDIPVNVTFGDFADGSEAHFLTLGGVPGDWDLKLENSFAHLLSPGDGPVSNYVKIVSSGVGIDGFMTHVLDVSGLVDLLGGTIDTNIVFDPKDWTSQRLDDGSEHSNGAAVIRVVATANEANLTDTDLTTENNTATTSKTVTVDIAEDIPTVKDAAIALDESDDLQTDSEKRVENGQHTVRVDAGQVDVKAALLAAGLTVGEPVSSGYSELDRIDMESDGTTDANPADVDGQESIQFTAYNGLNSGLTTTAGDNIYLFSSASNPAVVFGIVDYVLDNSGNLIGGRVALTATIDSDLVNENNTIHMYIEQYESLKHPNENSHDETIQLNLNYFVTDDEGDQSNTAQIQIQFRDDGPTIDNENAAVVIDDDNVPSANGNPGGVGDDAEANVTGTLEHNYGADEAGATTLLLDTGAPAGFTYELNGDGTVLTVKQGAVAVMTVTLDDATSGGYTVAQLAPISHPDGSDENNVEFTFNYRVKDGDGDTVDGKLSVSVDDDTPVFKDNALQTVDLSEVALPPVGGIYSLVGVTEPVTVELAKIAHADSAGYNSSYGYFFINEAGEPISGTVLWDNVKHEDGQTDSFTIDPAALPSGAVGFGFFLIPNGDSRNGGLGDDTEVTFKQVDGKWTAFAGDTALKGSGAPAFFSKPDLNPDGGKDHEVDNNLPGNSNWEDLLIPAGDGDFNDVNINVVVKGAPCAHVSGALSFAVGADLAGASLKLVDEVSDVTSAGQPVTATLSADGSQIVGMTAAGEVVYVVTLKDVDLANGSAKYDFVQFRQIDHAGDEGAVLPVKFSVTLTDGDVDTTTTNIVINLTDSGPTAAVARVIFDETKGNQGNEERNLTSAEQAEGMISKATQALAFDFGKDHIGGQIALTDKDGNAFNGAVSDLTDTQSGQKIYLFTEGNEVVGRVGSGGAADAGGAIAFKASLDQMGTHDAADFVIEQFRAFKHTNTSQHNDQTSLDDIHYVVTDGDGDKTAAQKITINIKDDGPTAHSDNNDADAVQEDLDQTASGNVLTNDDQGADGAIVTTTSAMVGTYGTVTIDANGAYSYVLNNAAANVQALADGETVYDTFGYEIKDGDGDVSTSTLKIKISGTNDAPVAVADGVHVAGVELASGDVDLLTKADPIDSEVFDFGAGNAGRSVTVSFDATTGGTWDQGAGSLQDTFTVEINGVEVLVTHDRGTNSYSFEAMTDNEGKVTVDFTADVTGSDETLAVSHLVVKTGAGSDWPNLFTDENASVVIDVLANDTDVDHGDSPATFSLDAASFASGVPAVPTATATISGNKLVFNPGTDFDYLADGETATVVIDYTMSDDSGASSSSTATIIVTGTNDAPVLSPLSLLTNNAEAFSFEGDLLGRYVSDAEGQDIIISPTGITVGAGENSFGYSATDVPATGAAESTDGVVAVSRQRGDTVNGTGADEILVGRDLIAVDRSVTAKVRGNDSYYASNFYNFAFNSAVAGEYITSITINLRGGTDRDASFDLKGWGSYGPEFGNNSNGLVSSDVTFSQNDNPVLTINFKDGAFGNGDVLSFGADTDDLGNDDANAFALAGVTFSVTLNDGTVLNGTYGEVRGVNESRATVTDSKLVPVDDVLNGDGGDDTLLGLAGDDILIGGAGDDVLVGGSGADRFVFKADTLGDTDTIKDFNLGDGDVLDLGELLTGFSAGVDNEATATALQDYLSISKDGAHTVITVDADGAGAGTDVTTIRLENIDLLGSGLEHDAIKALLDGGNIDVL
ncbi:DUF5801 repeats-in-toxin domain-containing protein [Kiloniella laminariae]|uniref:DUF5801 repeats-in-toxin domain-containing protein n=1 Tax=Kiloniella laminariae TaxID=454162 RepID=UPI00037875B2|nr:DUF5801 repeats-in-toxin domain-containing protein [Kiloniella laminariae]